MQNLDKFTTAYIECALCEKFAKEDEAKYGNPVSLNPWMRPLVGGGLPKGCGGATECFVFVEEKR